jgi:CelD/BcsL family acetyltransferase involved in cellulose biosynthesis
MRCLTQPGEPLHALPELTVTAESIQRLDEPISDPLCDYLPAI